MNEHNHHRIIDEFARKVRDNAFFPEFGVDVLKEASNFTDSVNAEGKYFYYHFYYDIEIVNGDTIRLSRVSEKTNSSSKSMNRCGDVFVIPISTFNYGLRQKSHLLFSQEKNGKTRFWNSSVDEKEFFAWINDKKKSPKLDPLDIGNQSDNVSFLHAMGAEDETTDNSRDEFEKHLRKCFSEYLFLKETKDAMFMLGIAFHGIMDSFTPSHTGFQKYTVQEMAFHAQGDVIPFECDKKIEFEPGQFVIDSFGAKLLAEAKKGYNGDDHLNDTEFRMLRIFIIICDFDLNDPDIKALLKGSYDLSRWYDRNGIKYYEPRSKQKLNDLLATKKYGRNAFVYSQKAIETLTEVYNVLSVGRLACRNKGYEYYSGKDGKNEIINNALDKWKKIYNEMHKDVKYLFRQNLLNHLFKPY